MDTQTSNAASLFLCNMEMDQILSSEARHGSQGRNSSNAPRT
jgi:hypothetical protein